MEKNCLSNLDAKNTFEYLQQLADAVGFTDEEDRSFRHEQYGKIACVSPSSVLAKCLNPTFFDHQKQEHWMPIFPLGSI